MRRYAVIDRDDDGNNPSLAYVVSSFDSALDLARDPSQGGVCEIWRLRTGWRDVVTLDANGSPRSDGTPRSDERAYQRIVPYLEEKMETFDHREESASAE